MLKISRILLSTMMVAGMSILAFAQDNTVNAQYNEHTVRQQRSDDIMFKVTLWMRMDLRRKDNAGFFATNNEISKILMEAVKNGKITPYRNDSLATRISKEEFLENLKLPQAGETMLTEEFEATGNTDWGTSKNAKKKTEGPQVDYYLPKQLYLLELKEDRVFDKRHSRMYADVQAITIVIPGEITPTGLDKVVGSFSFKELVDNVFKNNPDAIWYNMSNPAFHHNLADAFALRLFHGQVVKYQNPRDNTMVDMYGNNKKALIASEEVLHKLLEWEYTLWSY